MDLILLCGHFLDVIRATLEVVVGNMTHELGIIHAKDNIDHYLFLFSIHHNPLLFCSALY
jgi:hypothetical protein